MQRTHIWAQHVTVVTDLNSFPPKPDCCLCARKHTNNDEVPAPGIRLRRSPWERLSKNNKATETPWLAPSAEARNRIQKRSFTSERGCGSRSLQMRLVFISDTFFNSPSVCYVSGLFHLPSGWSFPTRSGEKKGVFCGLRCLAAVIG